MSIRVEMYKVWYSILDLRNERRKIRDNSERLLIRPLSIVLYDFDEIGHLLHCLSDAEIVMAKISNWAMR